MRTLKKLVIFILIPVLIFLAAFSLYKFTNNFKDWSFGKEKKQFSAFNSLTGKQINFETKENLNFDDGISFRKNEINQTKFIATDFKFKIDSDETVLKDGFDVLLKYKESEKEVSEVFVKINKENLITLTCKEPFDKQINLKIVSKNNKLIQKNILLDFEEISILKEDDILSYLNSLKIFNKNIKNNKNGNFTFNINPGPDDDFNIFFSNNEELKKDHVFKRGKCTKVISAKLVNISDLNFNKNIDNEQFYNYLNSLSNNLNTNIFVDNKKLENKLEFFETNKFKNYVISSASKKIISSNPQIFKNLINSNISYLIVYDKNYPDKYKLNFEQINIKTESNFTKATDIVIK